MSSFQKYLKRENGFTFIELLAAILVLTLGVFAVVSMFEMGLKTSTRASVRTVATNLANELLEKARNMPFDSITQSNLQSQLGTSFTRSGFTLTVSYNLQVGIDDPNDNDNDGVLDEDNNPLTGYKSLTVTVSWTMPAPASSNSVGTLIARGPTVSTGGVVDLSPPTWTNASTALSGSIVDVSTIYVSWNTSGLTDTGGSGLAGFYVYRDSVVIAIIAPAYSYHYDTSVPPGTYQYQVRAFDAAGNLTDNANSTNIVSITI